MPVDRSPVAGKRVFFESFTSPESHSMPDSKNAKSEGPTNAQIMAFMEELKAGQESLRAEIVQFRAEVNDLNRQFSERLFGVEERVKVHSEAINENRNEINRLKVAREIVITGIPKTTNENVSDIFNRICAHLGYESNLPSVFVHRFTYKKRDESNTPQTDKTDAPPISVEFSFVREKQLFLNRYFKSADLDLSHLGMVNKKRIYINERLTKIDMQIKKKAIELKKEGKLYSVSTRDGCVHVRITQTSEFLPINSLQQLD
jgi:hypothetical protein